MEATATPRNPTSVDKYNNATTRRGNKGKGAGIQRGDDSRFQLRWTSMATKAPPRVGHTKHIWPKATQVYLTPWGYFSALPPEIKGSIYESEKKLLSDKYSGIWLRQLDILLEGAY